MKKLLALFIFGFLFMGALYASVGKIVAASGEVNVLRDAKSLKAMAGFELEEKDVVNSVGKSKAQIIFNDKTVITIGRDSEFKINEYMFEAGKEPKASFGFAKGAFRSITGSIGKVAPDKFKLKTRTATIGIRGTQILAKIDGDDKIACTEGRIAVTDAATGKTVEVKAGQITMIVPGKPPTKPRAYKPKEIKDLASASGGGGEKMKHDEVISEDNGKQNEQATEDNGDEEEESDATETEEEKQDSGDATEEEQTDEDNQATEEQTTEENQASEEGSAQEDQADDTGASVAEDNADEGTLEAVSGDGAAPASETSDAMAPETENEDMGTKSLTGANAAELGDFSANELNMDELLPEDLEVPDLINSDEGFDEPEIDLVETIKAAEAAASGGQEEANDLVDYVVSQGIEAAVEAEVASNIENTPEELLGLPLFTEHLNDNQVIFPENDPYLSWGAWYDPAATSATPLNVTGGWVAGDMTPSDIIDGYIRNTHTASYSGGVEGIVKDTSSAYFMENGAVSLNINYGAANPVSGNIQFDANSEHWNLAVGSSNVFNTGFAGSLTTGTGSAVIVNSGELAGRFYGPAAESVGGQFQAGNGATVEESTKSAYGVFMGSR